MTNNPNNQYNVSTDEIMDFLKENMVTKEDAKAFVTKEDAKNFATKEDLGKLKSDMSKFKLDIIDHIDEKLADLKGDLVVLMRKEDRKVTSLVELLTTKNVITPNEAKSILQMEPFPKLMA